MSVHLPSSTPASVVFATLIGAWVSCFWSFGGTAPGEVSPSHDVECVGELQRIVELGDRVSWWIAIAKLLFALLCVLLAILLAVLCGTGGVAALICRRLFASSPGSAAHVRAEAAALRVRALERRQDALADRR